MVGTSTVFVSHSSQDKPIVDRITAKLQEAGINVWYDKFEIQAGDNIVEKINQGLKDSKYFLIVMSPNSLSSSWVSEETSYAVLQQITLKTVFVIPILLTDCEIPPLLKPRRYIDFRSSFDDGMDQLLRRLKKDTEIASASNKEGLMPWPDIEKSEKEYVYLYSNRFDTIFILPCNMNHSVSSLINYIMATLKLPYSKNLPELGLSWSFSYSIMHNGEKKTLSKSLAESGIAVGDTIGLSIKGYYTDEWEKQLSEMWSGDKLYEVFSASIAESDLKKRMCERGILNQESLKKISSLCFSHVDKYQFSDME